MADNKENNLVREIIAFLKKESVSVGERLPSEREMSKMYNASRNTVRGAIRTIAASGALEVKPNSGYYLLSKSALDEVITLNNSEENKKRISDQLEAFFLFEPLAVVLATERMDQTEKKKLEECVISMSNALLENNIDSIVNSHRRFHQVIAAGTGNQSIKHMLERLDITYVLVSNVVYKISVQERNKIFARHVNLYKAIVAGDSETARSMSLQMILSTALLLNKFEGIDLPDIIDKEIGDQILEMKIRSLDDE